MKSKLVKPSLSALAIITIIILIYEFPGKLVPNNEEVWNVLGVSNDKIWSILDNTKIQLDKNKKDYAAIYPQAVKDLNGKIVSVKGFMIPLEATTRLKHFILSVKTPSCPYCPPALPNQVIEVFVRTPVSLLN